MTISFNTPPVWRCGFQAQADGARSARLGQIKQAGQPQTLRSEAVSFADFPWQSSRFVLISKACWTPFYAWNTVTTMKQDRPHNPPPTKCSS